MQILQSQIIGQGKPLLILHGFLGLADNWRSMGLRFAQEGYEVHIIDQRNHGQSFHSPDFSYELMANDLQQYMQHHQLEKASIIGHSMGGKTAMLFSTISPTSVEKLIVVDIAPKHYPVHHRIIMEALTSVDFAQDNTRKAVEEKLAKQILDASVRQFLMKNLYWHTPEELAFRFNLKALRENLSQIGQGLPQNASFAGKTLFLRGANSTYITDDDQAIIRYHFPDSQIITIEKAGHWVQAENPADFFQTTLHFLNN